MPGGNFGRVSEVPLSHGERTEMALRVDKLSSLVKAFGARTQHSPPETRNPDGSSDGRVLAVLYDAQGARTGSSRPKDGALQGARAPRRSRGVRRAATLRAEAAGLIDDVKDAASRFEVQFGPDNNGNVTFKIPVPGGAEIDQRFYVHRDTPDGQGR